METAAKLYTVTLCPNEIGYAWLFATYLNFSEYVHAFYSK